MALNRTQPCPIGGQAGAQPKCRLYSTDSLGEKGTGWSSKNLAHSSSNGLPAACSSMQWAGRVQHVFLCNKASRPNVPNCLALMYFDPKCWSRHKQDLRPVGEACQ